MKKILIVLLLAFCNQVANAQTLAEWFKQKKTQKKYLVEQIAALKIYGGYLKKGYDIARKGLGTIEDIKNGDFNLHADFFGKLKAINPQITKYPRVKDILEMQQKIKALSTKTQRKAVEAKIFSKNQLEYIGKVYKRLDADCLLTISELEQIIKPGELEMTDDQRLERIEKLHATTLSQLRFAHTFSNNLAIMEGSKKGHSREIDTMRDWYGIKP